MMGGVGGKEEWRKTMKDDGLEGSSSKRALPRPHPGEVLHQRRKLPYSPSTMAVAGFLITAAVGYFTLYSLKKPQASAKDVAKVAAGTAEPHETPPSN